jgi:hypothetical protein
LLNKKTACDDNSEFTLFCLAWWQENSTRKPDPATEPPGFQEGWIYGTGEASGSDRNFASMTPN